jgi:diamine N-acetyltransferase
MISDLTSSEFPHIAIRRASADDAEALAAFAEQTFRDTFAADNDPGDLDAYCAAAFSVTAQRANLQDPAIDTLLVEEHGALTAYAQLRDGGPPEISGPAPVELWRFYVARTHHGRGIAQALMQAVVRCAAARGGRTLWLGVWERNLRAIAFYARQGFADVGAHEFVLGKDVQVDRLLARGVE